MAALKWTAKAVLLLLLLLSGLNLFAFEYWLVELNTSFAAYYLVLHLVSLPFIFVHWRHKRGNVILCCMIITVILLLRYSIPILSFYFPGSLEQTSSGRSVQQLRVASLHIRRGGGVEELAEIVSKTSLDLVVVSLPAGAKSLVRFLADHYQYNLIKLSSYGSELALFSSYPVKEVSFDFFERHLPPILVAEININKHPLLLLTLSLKPLSSAEDLADNVLLLRRVVTYLKHQGDTVLFADLGTTLFSSQYRRIKLAGSFKNSLSGYGVMFSCNCPWPCLPVSHLMVSNNLQVLDSEIIGVANSAQTFQVNQLARIIHESSSQITRE